VFVIVALECPSQRKSSIGDGSAVAPKRQRLARWTWAPTNRYRYHQSYTVLVLRVSRPKSRLKTGSCSEIDSFKKPSDVRLPC
jgi:hypothetical protein